MIAFLVAATVAAQPLAVEVGYEQLAAGQDAAAIARIEDQPSSAEEPARLINLGIAHARLGDAARARALFEAALASPDRMELETATGAWVDSRVLARQALAMLEKGQFSRASQIARN